MIQQYMSKQYLQQLNIFLLVGKILAKICYQSVSQLIDYCLIKCGEDGKFIVACWQKKSKMIKATSLSNVQVAGLLSVVHHWKIKKRFALLKKIS